MSTGNLYLAVTGRDGLADLKTQLTNHILAQRAGAPIGGPILPLPPAAPFAPNAAMLRLLSGFDTPMNSKRVASPLLAAMAVLHVWIDLCSKSG